MKDQETTGLWPPENERTNYITVNSDGSADIMQGAVIHVTGVLHLAPGSVMTGNRIEGPFGPAHRKPNTSADGILTDITLQPSA